MQSFLGAHIEVLEKEKLLLEDKLYGLLRAADQNTKARRSPPATCPTVSVSLSLHYDRVLRHFRTRK